MPEVVAPDSLPAIPPPPGKLWDCLIVPVTLVVSTIPNRQIKDCFIIFMSNLHFEARKEAKLGTKPKLLVVLRFYFNRHNYTFFFLHEFEGHMYRKCIANEEISVHSCENMIKVLRLRVSWFIKFY